MKRLLIHIALILPLCANAQKEVFMREFSLANGWFFKQPVVKLVQQYRYYKDTITSIPADSSTITIVKNGTSICYRIPGAESFSDKGYVVKINNADRTMFVSKTEKPDTAQLNAVFNQGFAQYSSFIKMPALKGISKWQLKGGTSGVLSVVIEIDNKFHRLRSLAFSLPVDHPLVSPWQKPEENGGAPVVIGIAYRYQLTAGKETPEKLSDLISIQNGKITPGSKYKTYTLIVPEK